MHDATIYAVHILVISTWLTGALLQIEGSLRESIYDSDSVSGILPLPFPPPSAPDHFPALPPWYTDLPSALDQLWLPD